MAKMDVECPKIQWIVVFFGKPINFNKPETYPETIDFLIMGRENMVHTVDTG